MRRSKTVKKKNNRKDLLLVAIEKEPVHAAIQLPLFGNPFETPANNSIPGVPPDSFPDLDTDLASFLPDYVQKRKKYGYEVIN